MMVTDQITGQIIGIMQYKCKGKYKKGVLVQYSAERY